MSQYFWPENFRINDLATDLVGRGHAVTVLTGLPNYPEGRLLPAFAAAPQEFNELQGVRVLRVPMVLRGQSRWRLAGNYLSYALSASTLGAWKLRGQHFDIVFAFQLSPVTVGLPAALFRWLKGAPLLFWVQDIWPESLEAIGAVRSPRLLRAVGRLVSFIYRRCDHILVQAQSQIPSVRARAAPSTRISYCPNWPQPRDAADTDARPASAVPTFPLTAAAHHFHIVFAGNLGEAQDLPAVLDAAEELQAQPQGTTRVHWHLVGDGSMLPWLQEQIALRSLGGCVTLVGRVPPAAMEDLYAQADALLVSLRANPLFAMTVPSKLQSYLAAGRPILGMLDGEGARVIDDAQAGLHCAAGDSRALAEAICRLVRLPEAARAQMGASGQRYARTHFDRDTLVAQLAQWMTDAQRASGR